MMINLIFRVVVLVKTLTPQFVLGKGLSCSHMPWDVRVAAHAKKVKLQSTPTLDNDLLYPRLQAKKSPFQTEY